MIVLLKLHCNRNLLIKIFFVILLLHILLILIKQTLMNSTQSMTSISIQTSIFTDIHSITMMRLMLLQPQPKAQRTSRPSMTVQLSSTKTQKHPAERSLWIIMRDVSMYGQQTEAIILTSKAKLKPMR